MLLAGPFSHTSTQYMDFVEFFNISLDLSIYFAHFSGCRASFVYSYHFILECFNLLSGVKLNTRSFCFRDCSFEIREGGWTVRDLLCVKYYGLL